METNTGYVMSKEITNHSISAVTTHTATIIFLHGLGGTGIDSIHVAHTLCETGNFQHVKFMFLNAPLTNITLWENEGRCMPGWFDIPTWNDIATLVNDEPGMVKTRDQVRSIIEDETTSTGIPASRIILGGFSQGGCIALLTGVTAPSRVAGVFGLSTYLPMIERVRELVAASEQGDRSLPIFMGHGHGDPKVKWNWGHRTALAIKDMGWPVEFRTYKGMYHAICAKELEDLKDFITKIIPDESR